MHLFCAILAVSNASAIMRNTQVPSKHDAVQKAIRANCVPTKRKFQWKAQIGLDKGPLSKLGVFHPETLCIRYFQVDLGRARKGAGCRL